MSNDEGLVDEYEKLQNSNIEKVIVTDAINIPKNRVFEKLELISLAELIAKELRNIPRREIYIENLRHKGYIFNYVLAASQ